MKPSTKSNIPHTQKQHRCARCLETKPESEFPPVNLVSNSSCLRCRKKRKRDWYLRNRGNPEYRERLRRNAHRHYWKHLKKNRERAIRYAKRMRNQYPEKVLLAGAKQRAKQKGLILTITLDDIVIPKYCPILGVLLVPMRDGKGNWENAPTIDRINSDLGYKRENIVIISRKANIIKSFGTIDEHRIIANWMERRSEPAL